MSQKSKATRTQIADLPEIAVELSEQELRIVSGSLRAAFSCYSRVSPTLALSSKTSSLSGTPTQFNTNGDWDSD